MYVKRLKCVECGETYPSNEMRFRCACSGSLDVVYDYQKVEKEISWELFERRIFSHHRYRELFPVVSWDNLISLGEGGTPLIRSSFLEQKLGLGELYFKMESNNPTGSFKDRGTSIELGKALDFNSKEIVVASTGNMGSSIAAYCAKAGLKASIIIPENVPDEKIKQMEVHGANLIEIEGDYSDAAAMARRKFEEGNIYLMGDYPYRGEGEKSVGFELMDQSSPDRVFLPIGNGTLMKGTWKGMREFEKLGLTDYKPQMIGVQAEKCSTVVRALENNSERVSKLDDPETVAGAIACGDPLDGEEALRAIVQSKGFGLEVSDEDIIEARDLLAEREGIYAEESGAVSVAGLIKAVKKNKEKIGPGDTIICVITGHGLKTHI